MGIEFGHSHQIQKAVGNVGVGEKFYTSDLDIVARKLPGKTDAIAKMGCVVRIGKKGKHVIYRRESGPEPGLCRNCHYNRNMEGGCLLSNPEIENIYKTQGRLL